MAETSRLSPRGRAVADRVAACHFDVEVECAFDRRGDCDATAAAHGLDAVDAGTKRRAYRLPDRLVDGDPVLVDYGRADFLDPG